MTENSWTYPATGLPDVFWAADVISSKPETMCKQSTVCTDDCSDDCDCVEAD